MTTKIASTNWFDLKAGDDAPAAASIREIEPKVFEAARPIVKELVRPSPNKSPEPEPVENRDDRTSELSRRKPPWRRVMSVAIFVTVVGAWFMLLRPTGLGGPASILVVRGVSMQPTMNYGDVILAHQHSAYEVGDIIAFRVPEGEIGAGTVVIHRIIGGDAASGFKTQGDGNNEPDEWQPVPTDILGAARWRIPLLGRALSVLRSTTGIALIAGLLASLLVLLGLEGPEQRRTRGRSVEGATPPKVPPTPSVTHEPTRHQDPLDDIITPDIPLAPLPTADTDPLDDIMSPMILLAPQPSADTDPLDDIITPETPLTTQPSADADPLDDIITPEIPLAQWESADTDPLDDIITPPLSAARSAEEHEAVGEYWGDDLGHLTEILRDRKRAATLFDDDLEQVVTPRLEVSALPPE